jgi:hypothetical protein
MQAYHQNSEQQTWQAGKRSQNREKMNEESRGPNVAGLNRRVSGTANKTWLASGERYRSQAASRFYRRDLRKLCVLLCRASLIVDVPTTVNLDRGVGVLRPSAQRLERRRGVSRWIPPGNKLEKKR